MKIYKLLLVNLMSNYKIMKNYIMKDLCIKIVKIMIIDKINKISWDSLLNIKDIECKHQIFNLIILYFSSNNNIIYCFQMLNQVKI
jgi:hypothetical protein